MSDIVCLYCTGVTQQLIDETRLTPETVMLEEVRTFLADGGDVGWQGCFGESLVSLTLVLYVRNK